FRAKHQSPHFHWEALDFTNIDKIRKVIDRHQPTYILFCNSLGQLPLQLKSAWTAWQKDFEKFIDDIDGSIKIASYHDRVSFNPNHLGEFFPPNRSREILDTFPPNLIFSSNSMPVSDSEILTSLFYSQLPMGDLKNHGVSKASVNTHETYGLFSKIEGK